MYSEPVRPPAAPAGTDSERAEPSHAPAGAAAAGQPAEPAELVEPTEGQAPGAVEGLAGAPERLLPALQRRGFERLMPVQRAVLESDDGACDLRITSQTGSGKTVALGFALAPALDDPSRTGPTTLVIAPTRELATQVKDELAWLFADLGVACDAVTGGTNLARERARLKRRPAVLVATPGRLLDHLREGVIDVSGVRQLVLDEADQMLDMGFKDELDAILAQLPAERRTHLVSATFPAAVLELADRVQREPVRIDAAAPGEQHADIEHVAWRIAPRQHYAALVNLLLLAGDERTLVFVRTREDTATLADKLAADGFGAMALSGDLAQAQRTRTLAAFRGGAVRTLVATDVAARGLDIPDVTTVVHVDLPIDAATYVHRSGRTGRAGQKGRSVLFVTKSAEGRARRLLKQAGITVEVHGVPGRAAVRERQLERAAAAARALVEATAAVDAAQLAAAAELLQDRDPAHVVAVLLAATTHAVREPFDVGEAGAPAPARDRRERAAPAARERASRQEQESAADATQRTTPRTTPRTTLPSGLRATSAAPPAWRRAGEPAGPAAAADRGGFGAFVRFRINWGRRDGADPRRILAHVCRRGDIDSRLVGNIDLQATSSTFEVDAAVADAFERRVAPRDRRDPHLVVARADTPFPHGDAPFVRPRAGSRPLRGAPARSGGRSAGGRPARRREFDGS